MHIKSAVHALGPGPLTSAAISSHIRPLFQKVLRADRIYLASHTLGRPLDQLHADVAEALSHWSDDLRDAWQPWLREEQAYRAALAQLLGLSQTDCVVPKTSAGQALRAVLNTLPVGATILTTTAEFASVEVVLQRYAALGRVIVRKVPPAAEALLSALRTDPDIRLVVASHVLYTTSAILHGLDEVACACRELQAELLIDCYHSLGVLPLSMPRLQCGFMIGGCYKYLRGGPGAAFLAIAPRLLPHLQPLDVGWFAQPSGGASGGDAWLDGTPAILPCYQARSGLAFINALGVDRLRAYQLTQTALLRQMFFELGVACDGGSSNHGAFVTVSVPDPDRAVRALAARGIIVDAREGRLRLCPDCLVTEDELRQAAAALAEILSIA